MGFFASGPEFSKPGEEEGTDAAQLGQVPRGPAPGRLSDVGPQFQALVDTRLAPCSRAQTAFLSCPWSFRGVRCGKGVTACTWGPWASSFSIIWKLPRE